MKLLEFPHSHFCEKARWALEHKGVPYERRSLFPGWHMRVVRKIAPKTTVPVLVTDAGAVQGSSEIISYLDEQFPANPLTIKGREAEHAAYEREVDKVVGESIRCLLYHHMLADSRQVSFYFMHRSPPYQRLAFRALYPVISGMIRDKYRIDVKTAAASKIALDRFLDGMETKLAKSPYLFGDDFSRADITAASLLCFLSMPPEHPVPWQEITVEEVRRLQAEYRLRPAMQWVDRLYRERRPRSS